MDMGSRIKELRKKNCLTQIEFAKEMGVTKGTVSTWETNRRKPSFDTLNVMCDLFDVHLGYIIGSSDTPRPAQMSEEEKVSAALAQIEEDYAEYAKKYVLLDEYGRNAVEAIIRAEYDRCRSEQTLKDSSQCAVRVRLK